ncbi:hypothetical protein SAMN05216466_120127 [Paraburkholderia phenazinium]|uniref:Uncharacterized protein n=1 Tax=Paraburkholderia phenazinium TaxID=60549 RepID=A0A1G8JJZ7_9BURK|nr:hypothetical protein SAMN05216466_120127 [Paraburkholderia phenazinium]
MECLNSRKPMPGMPLLAKVRYHGGSRHSSGWYLDAPKWGVRRVGTEPPAGLS